MPAILRGGDVVLAAETGSGKTLAYLAPLLDWALRSRRAAAAAAEAAEQQAAEQQQEGWQSEQRSGQRHRRRRGTATLVLCPNAALCEQVVAAAVSLRDAGSSTPLAATALVSSQSPPPLQLPDIVVTTPGALVSLMDNAGPVYGHEWTRAGAAWTCDELSWASCGSLMPACLGVRRVEQRCCTQTHAAHTCTLHRRKPHSCLAAAAHATPPALLTLLASSCSLP